MNFLVLIRKSDELGINFWLRLIALGLLTSLLFLVAYYFVFVNREATRPAPVQPVANTAETEKRKADAAFAVKIKSAIAQSTRLHNYIIGVEYKDDIVILIGEVTSEIDKEFAENLARETVGGKTISNQIEVVASNIHSPLGPEKTSPSFDVEELEMEANLRELIQKSAELQTQKITIKVQNRAVTLTGRVASAQQKIQAEQLMRSASKVNSVNNQLRVGN